LLHNGIGNRPGKEHRRRRVAADQRSIAALVPVSSAGWCMQAKLPNGCAVPVSSRTNRGLARHIWPGHDPAKRQLDVPGDQQPDVIADRGKPRRILLSQSLSKLSRLYLGCEAWKRY
jgi:hypothetical protein